MRVIALKAWSNGSYSMEEKQIADLPDALAETLIEGGIVAPTALPAITDADDGKVLTADSGVWVAANPASGGGVLVVNGTWNEAETECTLDKTWQEIHDAPLAVIHDGAVRILVVDVRNIGDTIYGVTGLYDNGRLEYSTNSASGYPVMPNNA